MKKIIVTGGSGGAGRYVVEDLIEHDYQVRILDIVKPKFETPANFISVDLTDYNAVYTAMSGFDAVIHLAANPEPDFDHITGADRFKNNGLGAYNVFQAAVHLDMKKIVWASSETVLGFPFDNNTPKYLPVDEDHIAPQNSYALSKVVTEELSRQMNKLYGIPIIALRYSNILYTNLDHPANFEAIPSYWTDAASRKFNLWGYIDARDAATAARLSLESNITGAETFIIAAEDTIMNIPNQELVDKVFPGTPLKDDTGEFQTLISIDKAKEVLGFSPQYSWRKVLNRQN